MTAKGLYDDAYGLPAMDTTMEMTASVADAMEGAFGAPWFWLARNSRGVGGSEPVTTDLSEPLMLSRLLEMYGEEHGLRVGIDADGELYEIEDQYVAPKWIIITQSQVLSSSSTEAYNMYMGRYRTTTGNATAYTQPPWDGTRINCGIVDLTQRGVMTKAQAVDMMERLLSAGGAGPTWTEALTLTADQIRTFGNQPAPLPMVKGGDRARIMSLSAAQQTELGVVSFDVTLGRVSHPAGGTHIIVEPAGVLPQTLEDAMEALLQERPGASPVGPSSTPAPA
ncbi:hypothetical protein [Microbacterium sp.]|uniref:hypothetical protein n=1 Tax=Microbacterium sp. TaxID=51671 RepID=UPI0037368D3C